ncbi:hypothetical protein RAL98_02400 [Staphylococcus sp. HKU1]|uniref:hypothetical protein n=2 Tax=Staphylococcus TaxID=1279 RepID=UPI003AAB4560
MSIIIIVTENMIKDALSSKVLYTLALSQKLQGTSVTANLFHPGYVSDSNLLLPKSKIGKFGYKILSQILILIFKVFSEPNPDVGKKLVLDTDLSQTSGKFFNEKREIVPLSNKYSQDKIDQIFAHSKQF